MKRPDSRTSRAQISRAARGITRGSRLSRRSQRSVGVTAGVALHVRAGRAEPAHAANEPAQRSGAAGLSATNSSAFARRWRRERGRRETARGEQPGRVGGAVHVAVDPARELAVAVGLGALPVGAAARGDVPVVVVLVDHGGAGRHVDQREAELERPSHHPVVPAGPPDGERRAARSRWCGGTRSSRCRGRGRGCRGRAPTPRASASDPGEVDRLGDVAVPALADRRAAARAAAAGGREEVAEQQDVGVDVAEPLARAALQRPRANAQSSSGVPNSFVAGSPTWIAPSSRGDLGDAGVVAHQHHLDVVSAERDPAPHGVALDQRDVRVDESLRYREDGQLGHGGASRQQPSGRPGDLGHHLGTTRRGREDLFGAPQRLHARSRLRRSPRGPPSRNRWKGPARPSRGSTGPARRSPATPPLRWRRSSSRRPSRRRRRRASRRSTGREAGVALQGKRKAR